MRRPRRRTYTAISEINITNLVDVVLVLLIIFMISAPLLQSGIEVDLPETKAAAIDKEAEGVVITIDAKGGIYISDKWVRADQFEAMLKEELAAKNSSSVYLRGDSTAMYGVAISVIGKVKEMGIESIGLVTATDNNGKKSKSRK